MLLYVFACQATVRGDHVDGVDTGSGASEAARDGVRWGEEVLCEAPVAGFDRLEDQTEERGLDIALEGTAGSNLGGGLAASDLDGDGDIDLVFGTQSTLPRVLRNDGHGVFDEVGSREAFTGDLQGGVSHFGVGDLDQDGLPDLLLVSADLFAVAWNLGNLVFSEAEALWFTYTWPKGIRGTLSLGDVDGDGDLDALLPGIQELASSGDSQAPTGASDVVLLQTDTGWVVGEELTPEGTPGLAITGVFTDRDADGDADLLVLSDRAQLEGEVPPNAFYRNDGGTLHNDASELGVDFVMSAMGLVTGDWNGDGALDYCASSIGSLVCLTSDSEGYYDAGQAMGLTATHVAEPSAWSGWSVALDDLDNDGHADLAVAGGAPLGGDSAGSSYPDALFRGEGPMQFVQDTPAAFADATDHYGLVTADLDGDGYLEVVVSGAPGPPTAWWNVCGEGAWVEVRIEGEPPNLEALGARLVATWEGGSSTREVQTMRSLAQSSRWLHVGLGVAESVDLTVTWPDGARVEHLDLPVRRRIVVERP